MPDRHSRSDRPDAPRITDADRLAELAGRPAVARARTLLRETDAATLEDQFTAVRIPAPPFGEAARAAWMRERFGALGLADVAEDDAGNVLATLPACRSPERAPVILAAHLDTIFAAGTEIRLAGTDGRWTAPGIADNARGLAVLLAVARALRRAGVATRHPVVFAATVGEEGPGDLRGVRHLFRDGSPWRRAKAFIALDGSGCRRVVSAALAVRRLRALVSGAGGHTWADWGRPNPLHALGSAVAELAAMPLPDPPASSLHVGRMGGGTAVNSIPAEAWLELDIRSEDEETAAELERRARRMLEHGVDRANAGRRRGEPKLELRTERTGHRPGGRTPPDAEVLLAAEAATRFVGRRPERVASSTDANVPMALGVPAVALGAGGDSGEIHTTAEWYSNDGGPDGAERALLILLAVAGVADGEGV